MRVLLEGYRNVPGQHCGSTAMRNLLLHCCGLDLSESQVFGLGSGLDCMYIQGGDPALPVVAFGRGATLEVDAAAALGIDYREQPELDDARAWEVVRQEVLEGRPTMLSGEAYYLAYRGFGIHFPAHRFVLVGFDDEEAVALVADRIEAAPQRCALDALRLSRNPPSGLSTFNLWGKFHDPTRQNDLATAYELALGRTARRMLGEDPSQAMLVRFLARGREFEVVCGLKGLRTYRERLPGWRERADGRAIAGYAAQCIEKFGTGGGNFRRMFATFLREARDLVPALVPPALPELADRSAARWQALSVELGRAAEGQTADDPWARAAAVLDELVATETRLFEELAAALR